MNQDDYEYGAEGADEPTTWRDDVQFVAVVAAALIAFAAVVGTLGWLAVSAVARLVGAFA